MSGKTPHPPGSILKRRLNNLWGLFYHHMGIAMADGTVIHFNGENKKDRTATLRRDPLETFAAGRTVQVHAAAVDDAHGRAVCAAAQAALRQANAPQSPPYDFKWNNCEDFAVACYETPYHEGDDDAT